MELIFEIGCEDLPARFVDPALARIESEFVRLCAEARIEAEGVRVLGTPRRLTLLVDALAEKQADLEEERTGPPAKIAFKDGQPTKAAEGFARGQGVDVSSLYTVETERGEYVAVKVFEQGKPSAEVVPAILHEILGGLSFPKSMRWATYRPTFARPVRWILAVLDGELVDVSFANVSSANHTFGHRFVPGEDGEAPQRFEVRDIAGYLEGLSRTAVMLDPAARRARIETILRELAEEAGGALVEDPELVDEVVHLVEQPHGVRVAFGDEYLELPDEVLISSMRSHQRYFAVANPESGELESSCLVIYNTPVRDPDVVRAGNLRVLKARLDDARFFWEQDLRQPLDAFVDRLGDVVWLQQIGTVKERSARISLLAGHIAEALGFDDETSDHARRAGYLTKADLATQMVYEFPDLQGVMGREYALKSGEPEPVARAIYEQYLPRGAEDELPRTDAGACVAIAEKLDALVGCFGIGLVPTSTADPYALRRAAIGVIRVLQDRGYTVSLPALVQMAREVYDELDPEALDLASDELAANLLEFFRTRLKNQLAQDHPADVVEAVLSVGMDDVLSISDRVEALASLRDDADFARLAEGFKRVVNILRKQAANYDPSELTVTPERFVEDAEKSLHDAHGRVKGEVEAAIEGRDWRTACEQLSSLKDPVDAFFDQVMVMADDPELKRNRLALLFELESLFRRVADISVIS